MSLRLCCKHFRDVSFPFLYRSIKVNISAARINQTENLLRRVLEDDSKLVSYVRNIVVTGFYNGYPPRFTPALLRLLRQVLQLARVEEFRYIHD